ncbi:hypothetical protein K488DRAFT_74690 [Vararia minispora EC-137]|uniref:Uncharacterized protein n=1 Tax=Vararia minispora EC-137 TaxID=1314806 RepID=A0ACB8Q636_9AGAM|nr:hypothetical protein K488DRAFT_74690 [Vararia minispora EC-137]
MQHSQHQEGADTVSSPALRRGMACSNCRLRKKKCDGIRPVCGPCENSGRPDCEFPTDAPSSTHELEQRVAVLRARLRGLRRVRAGPLSTKRTNTSSPGTGDDGSSTASDLSFEGPANPVAREVYEGRAGQIQTNLFSIPSAASNQHKPIFLSMLGLSKELIDKLFSAFFSRDQPLWFLHPARFRAAAMLPHGHPARVHPALEATVCLLGISDDDPPALETMLREHATSELGNPLSGKQALYVLQTYVLLGAYTLARGEFLVGQEHIASAASIVLVYGLHKGHLTRETLPYDTPPSALGTAPLALLAPPRDEVEEGERTLAFWTVFALERVWGSALGTPARIRNGDGGVFIEAPWPLEMKQYEQLWADYVLHGKDIIRRFLAGIAPESHSEEQCPLGRTVKAALLLEYANLLIAAPDGDTGDDAVATLEARIETLVASIGPVDLTEPRSRAAFVLVHGARMALHHQEGSVHPEALRAAQAIALSAQTLYPLERESLGFFEAAVGASCHVFSEARMADTPSIAQQEVTTALNAMLGILESWSLQSSFIAGMILAVQLDRLQGYLSALDLLV